MIEVSMGNQNHIDWRKVVDFYAGLPKPFQYEKPAGEVGINDNILATNLQEETGVSDEGYAHLPVRNQHRAMRLAGGGSQGGVPHQASKLPGTLAQRRIFERLFQHRAKSSCSLEVATTAPG